MVVFQPNTVDIITVQVELPLLLDG